MSLQVGKIVSVAGKLESGFPTFQLALSHSHKGVDGNLKLETFPSGFPTFQLPACAAGHGFAQMESWKNLPSYGAVCPGLTPGTPACPCLPIPNNNHKEEGAWAD